MKTFPLQSLTIIEAQQKQFALVDSICRHFPGSEFLTGGDLGLTPGLNQPRITQRVEQVLADAFHAQAAALVQGAGTGAIRAGLAALLKPGQRLLVHDAPVYPTTRVIIEQMGLTLITVDFNDLSALKQVVDEQQPDAALVQHTRQQPQDSYVLADVLATLRAAGVPALTDDNYAVMKVARMSRHFPASSYLGQRVLVQWSAMLMLSTVFAPRFTPAVARSRAHRRWKSCVVWCLRQ
ncbi:aminotransferase class I and II family protein [Escherichia coli 2872800]|nr:aminotransferase class I and II family protein [Escherichia coli 2875000]EMV43744.1 aminotransferase class I and II family protein [Escherichia coli 2872800]EMV55069.1 aminotransferase class I and II family protein [Escherichia coli 2867750]EMV67681.1 aminotransferase class I and II family protein [Escherichia coli 2866550]EMV71479.1 aminotransferase class I and II family protein [Escherichia coli 2866750]EMV99012.1 aminotransferase class I and II family protein [Escherichia coli 2851500]E